MTARIPLHPDAQTLCAVADLQAGWREALSLIVTPWRGRDRLYGDVIDRMWAVGWTPGDSLRVVAAAQRAVGHAGGYLTWIVHDGQAPTVARAASDLAWRVCTLRDRGASRDLAFAWITALADSPAGFGIRWYRETYEDETICAGWLRLGEPGPWAWAAGLTLAEAQTAARIRSTDDLRLLAGLRGWRLS